MTESTLLIGSLSSDLFRIVDLHQRGSQAAAERFLVEAKRWAEPLSKLETKKYIKDIAAKVFLTQIDELSSQTIERFLMYGVLLQNYTLHNN